MKRPIRCPCSSDKTQVYIFFAHREKRTGEIRLPTYPAPEGRDRLYLVLGEVHHPKKPEPVENPRWLVIPDRGLFTGIAIVGAIGTGKTTGCMYPFAKQLLNFRVKIEPTTERCRNENSHRR